MRNRIIGAITVALIGWLKGRLGRRSRGHNNRPHR
ncbi:hypothetical protein IWX64_003335 [Arthrobacter sp. CAN_A212]